MMEWQGLISILIAVFMFFILPVILGFAIVIRDARWQAEQSCCRKPRRIVTKEVTVSR
ncbi:MAG: hypothetical protein ABF968_00865 [Acetobacter sp.]|uniref:hypothetical protein n=1 Tax=Acetobacter sp. TaxID=440 RepID=UPI0039E90780